ncbi:hypothetical protein ACFWC9_25475 [Streptomyces goshikiensis]|uniref:hypothetical protein n=1 Tax=Streptomyces goshikiensis TaxID=1942 RepID=UPI003695990F
MGNGSDQLTYVMRSTSAGVYNITMEVSGTSGTTMTAGVIDIQGTQSVGNVVLMVPHVPEHGRTEFVRVIARETQCDAAGDLTPGPPAVSSFTFTLPTGRDVIMLRTALPPAQPL